MDHGFQAVSHRAVAVHAGLPLAATTYYFNSLEELLESTLRQLADSWLADANAVVAGIPRQFESHRAMAEALVRVAALGPAADSGQDSPTLISLYDRYIEAARHPLFRPVVAEYNNRIQDLLADILEHHDGSLAAMTGDRRSMARLVLAVIDGALLRALAEGLPTAPATTAVERLLGVLSR